MRKLFTLLLAIVVSVSMAFAQSIKVGDLYYLLDKADKTASVTMDTEYIYGEHYQGLETADIMSKVNYKDEEYTVTAIADHAFYSAYSLRTITIPASVKTIGMSAFGYCTELKSVNLSEGLQTISNYAFEDCFKLESFNLPESLQKIGMWAFGNCVGLKTLNISSGITSIGAAAFGGWKNLESITVASDNPVYDSRDNCNAIIETESNKLIQATKNTSIPTTVTEIGSYAYYKLKNITSITIPASIKNIVYTAFRGANKLESIKVAAGNTVYDSRNNCNAIIETASNTLVQGCKNTVIPSSVKTIGSYAFYQCELKSIVLHNNLDSIKDNAFNYCIYLTSIVIPESVKYIGSSAFRECKSLYNVSIPSGVEEIGSSAFSGVLNITYNGSASGSPWGAKYMNKYIEGGLVFEDVTKTHVVGCINNAGVVEIVIPKSVTTIDAKAFDDVNYITSVKVEKGNATYDSRDNCNAIIETASNTLLFGFATTKIPNTVTEIGESAFYHRDSLKAITIPASVKKIGKRAFALCASLASVICSEGLDTIGSEVFYECHALKKIQIPNGLKYIGGSAFYFCEQLSSIVIPESMTEIEQSTFEYCYQLGDITLPETLKRIGNYAFYYCADTAHIVVPSGVEYIGANAFVNILNVFYDGLATGSPWGAVCVNGYMDGPLIYADAEKTQLLRCSQSAQGEVVIPASTKEIGERAFAFCYDLTSIVIPEGVVSIASEAFCNCNKLESINLPNSISETEGYPNIGDRVFMGCDALKAPVYNNRIFAYMPTTYEGAYTIPDGIKYIWKFAFNGCSKLTAITLPNSVTEIGGYSFPSCINLETVTIATSQECEECTKHTNLTTIAEMAFYGCTKLSSINLEVGLRSIGNQAFSNCVSFTTLYIPYSVTSIGYSAFNNVLNIAYNGIATPTYSNKNWGARCRNGEVDGYFVYMPANESENPEEYLPAKSWLMGCSTMAEGRVEIPSTVTTIDQNAFYNCNKITSITIPSSLQNVYSDAFSGCTFDNVYISDLAAWCAIYFANSSANPVSTARHIFINNKEMDDLVIPSGVSRIGSYAFYYMKSIKSVTIPEGVTYIGQYAFSACDSLQSVLLPSSLERIDNYAFAYTTSLESPVIPSSVSGIGYSAFQDLLNIMYEGEATGSPWGAKCVNGYMDGWLVYEDASKQTIVACSTKADTITIPNSVTTIKSWAFSSCYDLRCTNIASVAQWLKIRLEEQTSNPKNLHVDGVLIKNLDIPEGIDSVPSYAFYGCGIKSLTLPSTLQKIGRSAFRGNNIEEVIIPESVTEIGEYAFYSSKIKRLTIPSGLKQINRYVFYGNNLGDFVIPEGVEEIGYEAFGHDALTSVTIPKSLKKVDQYGFDYNNSLKKVIISDLESWCSIDFYHAMSNPIYYAHTLYLNDKEIKKLVIPEGKTSISAYSFYGCQSLTSLRLPSTISSIGGNAFEACSNLDTIIVFNPTPPSLSKYALPSQSMSVFIPIGSKETYQSLSYWEMHNLIEMTSMEQNNHPTGVSIAFTNHLWEMEGSYIVACGVKDGDATPGNILEYIGLEPNSEYKDIPVVLTANTGETETINISFKTEALTLTTKESKAVSSTTALLFAVTNMSDAETNCGFEWKRENAPEGMAGTKVFCPVASGMMAGRLKNLKDDVYYKYRAFYQSAAGQMYYGEWQYIFTGDVTVEFDPVLYTYSATVVKETEATISGYALAGAADFTEQGFEYWAESRATEPTTMSLRKMKNALGEHFFVQASGINMRVTLTNLDPGTVYKYRAYGKVGDQVYYGAEQSFTTRGTYVAPSYLITFLNWDGTELQKSQVTTGTIPEYTGITPVRPDDEQYTYIFKGWTPELVAVTADAVYTAEFYAEEATAIDNVQTPNVQCTKLIENGVLYLIFNGTKYNVQGQVVK